MTRAPLWVEKRCRGRRSLILLNLTWYNDQLGLANTAHPNRVRYSYSFGLTVCSESFSNWRAGS